MTSNQIVRVESMKGLGNALDLYSPALMDLFPSKRSLQRAIRTVLTHVQQSDARDKLLACSRSSVLGCVLKCAEWGIVPDGNLAALVPFKDTCTLMVMYRGFIHLGIAHGGIQSVEAVCVYDGDEFFVRRGTEPHIQHVQKFQCEECEDNCIGVYAVATLPSRHRQFEYLTRDRVNKYRDLSPSYKYQGAKSIWGKWWPEMAKKTAIRRLFSTLVTSQIMAEAANVDERGDIGAPQGIDFVDQAELPEAPPPAQGVKAVEGRLQNRTEESRGDK